MKRLILLSLSILIIFVAIGYGFSQTPTLPKKSFEVTLTFEEWQSVTDAMGEKPYKTSAPIIQKIVSQVNAQISADTIKPKNIPNGKN